MQNSYYVNIFNGEIQTLAHVGWRYSAINNIRYKNLYIKL